MPTLTEHALELSGVRKRYGRNEALKGVDLAVRSGEVHGLLGKNGAGKSTLIKVIGGVVSPDEGSVSVRGVPVDLGSPGAARHHDIAVVHQELSLVPQMTIAENIFMGRWKGQHGLFDAKATVEAARPLLKKVGLDRDPAMRVELLGMAERQLVEIAKALTGTVEVLLLDEPTSSLSDTEAERLFGVVRELCKNGVAVIYVSHRLSEVLTLTDRISILRDGRIEEPIESADATERHLAKLMVGDAKEAESVDRGSVEVPDDEPLLSIKDLCVDTRLRNISLDLHRGELVAVFGLIGAGRTRLARSIFGLENWSSGEATLDGKPFEPRTSLDAIRRRVGFVGEDRSAGLVAQMSVAENIVLGSLPKFRVHGQWSQRAANSVSHDLVKRLGIKVESVDNPVNSLSGGNQQKVLLARWLCTGARLLLLDDPVRGVDVGAKEEIFAELNQLVEGGACVVLFTSDAAEAQRFGHRILVMSAGQIVAELPPGSAEDEIVAAAGGVRV